MRTGDILTFVLERQHAAASVLDYQDLSGAEKLLRDDERAEGFAGASPCVPNDVCVAEIDTIGTGRIDAGIHASY